MLALVVLEALRESQCRIAERRERRMIAAPIQEEGGGRLGLIAQYEWPPAPGRPVNPVVTVL